MFKEESFPFSSRLLHDETGARIGNHLWAVVQVVYAVFKNYLYIVV